MDTQSSPLCREHRHLCVGSELIALDGTQLETYEGTKKQLKSDSAESLACHPHPPSQALKCIHITWEP